MREIKFRAYHKKEKRFYYFDLETCTQTIYIGYYHPITGEKDCELDDSSLYSEKQLYTGLKDKNGKEAYHKDIIKDFVLGELWIVEWSDEYACFELQRITENTIKVKGIVETISACRIVDLGEIIGNIYENKELLEQRGKE